MWDTFTGKFKFTVTYSLHFFCHLCTVGTFRTFGHTRLTTHVLNIYSFYFSTFAAFDVVIFNTHTLT